MIEEGSETGVIERQEHEMARNVFRLDDRQIGSLMIPRADIAYLDVERSLEENLQWIAASDHYEDKGRYHALSGLIMRLLGRMPQTGDIAHRERWQLEVVDLDGKRVASQLPEPAAPPTDDAQVPDQVAGGVRSS